MKTKISHILLTLLVTSSALGEQEADQLKQRILAQAQKMSATDYSFTRTVHSEQLSGGVTEKKVTIEKFDPRQAPENRWRLTSVDGSPPAADVLNRFETEAAKRPVPGYHRLASYFGSPASTFTDAKGRTVFHFAALPKGTVIALDTDVSQSATIDAVVEMAEETPFIGEIHISVRPVRVKLVARLEKYESTAVYRRGPAGQPMLYEQTTAMAGSGLGQRGSFRGVSSYSDYQPAKH